MQKHSLRADEWMRLASGKYLDMVYRLAFAKTKNRSDAEDITQNTMLKLLKHVDEIESEAHLKRWLIRVTVNESISLFRSAWKRLSMPMDEARLAGITAPEQNDALDEALATLNAKYRVVVHLFYYEGLTTAEIAEILDVKPATVRERLHRARVKLKEQLVGEGGDVFV